MARHIDADDSLENLKKQYGEELGWQCTINLSDIGMMIEDAPTADVVEVKHGYWFDTYKGGSKKGCSVCHCQADLSKQGKEYCSHCGAKMDGKPQKEV